MGDVIDRMSWTSLAADGGLLLDLGCDAWPLIEAGVEIAGLHFQSKRELHVTLFTRSQARALRGCGVDAVALRAQVAGLDWRWRPLARAWRLRRVRDGRQAQSIVLEIDMPAQLELRRRIAVFANLDFGDPVPHITLYTCGDGGGISVPDRQAFETLRVHAIDIATLAATPPDTRWRV